MKRKGLALLVALLMVTSIVMPVFASGMPFADVPKDHWAYDSVAEMAASGLIIGYPDGSFKGERQFTRYEMAMVFARVLGRLDTLIAAEVGAEVKAGVAGLSDDIYAEVAKAMTEEMARVKAELSAHVDSELAGVELPDAKVVERVVVEKPVEVDRPFELTDEAKAVIAKVVADMVAEQVAGLEPQVVDQLADEALSAKDLQGLMAAVANAQSSADFNAYDIEELQADVAAARRLIDDLKFDAEVAATLVEVADQKADRALAVADAARADAADVKAATDEAQATATAGKEAAGYALQLALGAQREAEDAAYAAEENTQEIRNLALAIAALEGDVESVRILLEATTLVLETEIAAMSEEFGPELESLGVRVAELETIVVDNTARIAALEEDLAQHKAETVEDVISLRVADLFMQEEIYDLADAQAETTEHLAVVDAEQKATAKEFAGFVAEHEKVKLSGSTETLFHTVGIKVEDDADFIDDDGDFWVFEDPRDRDDDDTYERTAKLQQKLTLSLAAAPADGVNVTADLAAAVDVFGHEEKDNTLKLEDIALEVTTDKALRSLYAGKRDEEDIAARYNEFIMDDEGGDMKAVAANVVLGNLDTEIQLFRPWDDEDWQDDKDEFEKQYAANFGSLVNAAYKISDAFVIDLQYGRMWREPNAQPDMNLDDAVDDWAYSVGLSGELALADYSLAYATNEAEQTGYLITVGKSYGPEPEDDEDDLRPTWDVSYKSVGDDGFETFLAGDVGEHKSTLKLTADNFELIGLTLGGAYTAKTAHEGAKDGVTAMKFTAAKKDLFLDNLTVSGQYAKIDDDAKKVTDKQSLLGKIAYEPTIGALKLAASYEYSTNAIDGAFDNADKWIASKNDGKAAPESTVALSAEYPVEIWDTTITGFVGYENRESKEIGEAHGRKYVKPLMTYKVSAERDIGSATVLASYRHRTDGPSDNDGKYPKLDKTADFKLTYPVIADADLELGYRWMDVEAYDSEYDYTVNEVKAGLKFTF